MTTKKYYITLIHGTFAHNASWIQQESEFSNKLKKTLAAEVIFEKYNWSGKNSYKERILAGEKLRGTLSCQLKNFPDYVHIVIGHSHAGNVIFYALKDHEELCAKFKIITLATPFLISKIKMHRASFKMVYLIKTMTIVVLAGAGCLLLFFIPFLLTIEYGDKYMIPFFLGTVYLLYLITQLLSIPKVEKLFEKIQNLMNKEESIKEIFDRIDIAPKYNVSLLSIILKKDEVKFWLLLSNTFSMHGRKLFFLSNKYLKKISDSLFKIFIYSLILFLALCIMNIFIDFNLDFIGDIYAKASFYGVLFYILYYKMLSWVKRFFLVFSANPLFFGWKSWRQYLFVQTTPSSYPSHVQDATFFELDVSKVKIHHLRHSQVYSNDLVIETIIK